MFQLADGRECFYQWDIDRYIIVTDRSISEVHFCNKTDDCSLVVEVIDGYAEVPNILLQSDFPIRVYAYCLGYTKVEKTFKVITRTKPSDYIYTETEVKTYNAMERKIENFEDRLSYVEEGYSALETDGYATRIEIPDIPDTEAIISKLSGNTYASANLVKPEKLFIGGNMNKEGSTFTYYEDKIVVDYDPNYSGKGLFAFGLELDVKPNTVYRLSFNRNESCTVGTAYFYTNRLWGTSAPVYSPSMQQTKNIIKFTDTYLTFNSGDYTKLYIGLYSGANRTISTETFSHFMIKEGAGEIAYVPYKMLPSNTRVIEITGVAKGDRYYIPEEIYELPGYGHTDSTVDFIKKTYSYRTVDGVVFNPIPTVIDISDIMPEPPRMNIFGNLPLIFIDTVALRYTDIKASILFKRDGEYATKAYVDEAISNIDISGVDLSEYVTESELEQKGYLTEHQSLENYATNESVRDSIESVKEMIPDVDITNYYTKEETDSAIYNSKDTYYLDFSQVTETEQPATEDMIEFATRFIAGQNVCAHVRGMISSLNTIKGYQPMSVQKGVGERIQLKPIGLNIELLGNSNHCNYYSYEIRNTDNGWLCSQKNFYNFALATTDYVDNLFSNIATAEGGSY